MGCSSECSNFSIVEVAKIKHEFHLNVDEDKVTENLIGGKLYKGASRETFPHKPELDDHIHPHTGKTQFECTTCFKIFSKKDHLDAHIRTHTGEKPYKCTTCEKSFPVISTLTNYIRVHTGEKVYNLSEIILRETQPR